MRVCYLWACFHVCVCFLDVCTNVSHACAIACLLRFHSPKRKVSVSLSRGTQVGRDAEDKEGLCRGERGITCYGSGPNVPSVSPNTLTFA